jgi:hypothetical protein
MQLGRFGVGWSIRVGSGVQWDFTRYDDYYNDPQRSREPEETRNILRVVLTKDCRW